MTNHEPDERLRRQAAAMRFLSQMHGIGTEADVIRAVIQAAAVWYDLDARAYRRDLRNRDVLETWLPGAWLDSDPRELTTGSLVTTDQAARISLMADFEQLGWHNAQREVVLLPIAPAGRIRWLLAVLGAIDSETEATLLLVCRTAASVLEQLASAEARALADRLSARAAEANGAVAPVADALLAELMTVTGAVRGTLAMRFRAADRPDVLAARGDVDRAEPRFDVTPGEPVVAPEWIALAMSLGGGADALLDLAAGPAAPFTVGAALLAEAGASVIRAWLAGLALADRRAPVSERTEVSPAPPFEKSLDAEVGRARRLELTGGVVVVSLQGREAAGDLQARRALIGAVKAEIRSADLLGQLASGEFAALLVRANESGIKSAEKRLRQRIDRLVRDGRMPAAALGSALYPPAKGETLGMLLERARTTATRTDEPRFFS